MIKKNLQKQIVRRKKDTTHVVLRLTPVAVIRSIIAAVTWIPVGVMSILAVVKSDLLFVSKDRAENNPGLFFHKPTLKLGCLRFQTPFLKEGGRI